jgi:tryptophan synthase alpha chain
MVAAGVNILELGVPFSDPIADGPTIQYASQQSLKNGTTLPKILNFVAQVKKESNIPIVLMSYLNPILQFGLEAFSQAAAKVGVSGIIVPDTIPEESDEIRAALAKNNIHVIHLVAPTTPSARQKMIAKTSRGFLYAVSVAGVTGARKSFSAETKNWLGSLKKNGALPVCVGFGISGADQVRFLKNSVDGFIVGSALIDIIRKNKSTSRLNAMKKFIRTLSKECD